MDSDKIARVLVCGASGVLLVGVSVVALRSPRVRRPALGRAAYRGLAGSTVFDRAKKHFGTTYDFREAGYILPDGTMLDFSEKNNGGDPGTRNMDHRQIEVLYHSMGDRERSEKMYAFVRAGAIRVLAYGSGFGIDLAHKPTQAQMQTIARGMRQVRPEFIQVDVHPKAGHRYDSIAATEMNFPNPGRLAMWLDETFAKR